MKAVEGLSGKRIVVVGASAGIGRRAAEVMLASGADVLELLVESRTCSPLSPEQVRVRTSRRTSAGKRTARPSLRPPQSGSGRSTFCWSRWE